MPSSPGTSRAAASRTMDPRTPAHRRQRQWRWPRHAVIVPLDLALAVTVCLLLNALALRIYTGYTARARFAEVLLAASAGRYSVVEAYAISGEAMDMPAASGQPTLVQQANPSEHMRRPGPAATAPDAVSKPAAGPGRDKGTVENIRGALSMPVSTERRTEAESRYVSAVRLQGAAVVVEGELIGPEGSRYQFALSALVQDGRVPQVVVWDCGAAAAPAGWTGPTVLLDHAVPEAWLPNRCRVGRVAS